MPDVDEKTVDADTARAQDRYNISRREKYLMDVAWLLLDYMLIFLRM